MGSADNDRSAVARMLSGGHVGGHLTGGHVGALTTTTTTANMFEEEITTPAPNADVRTNKNEGNSGGHGVHVLLTLLGLLGSVGAMSARYFIRRMRAAKSSGSPVRDTRQGDLEVGGATVVREPSRTLLDGDAREAKKIQELTCSTELNF